MKLSLPILLFVMAVTNIYCSYVAENAPPNVIIFMSDEQGNNLECLGNPRLISSDRKEIPSYFVNVTYTGSDE